MSETNPLGSSNGLLTFVLAGLLVAALAYVAAKFLGNWHATQAKGRRLRVLEGVPVGKDRQLLLVAVGKEVLVVGASGRGVQLVHQVKPDQAAELLSAEPARPAAPEFAGFAQLESSVRANLERIRKRLAATGEDDHV